ncbi:hypothetical protein BaRGS_00031958 [Batillaria attramentaria]|uniref:3'-5' exonuclease domain-containing protein n=1 Tax=Batillaria attramentaria TaxID=370345 RepID=A0ABD0JPL2_9CAEN
MASGVVHVEVVDTVRQCQRAVQLLERENVVAADAEGINMTKTGPLTLLQIGTERGHVYLFDVKREPRMFKEGGLKRLLESESVVKVMHSSKNDGDALYWQHGVELRGVFDTQLAQVLLDKANGRRYPLKHKLADVVSLHCPDKAASVEQEKDVVQTKWNKLEGEYWGKRPLTDEMKELLQRLGRMETLKTTVEKEIRSKRDRAVFDRIVQEEKETLKSVLTDFANSPSRPRKLEDITDEDVLGALGHLRLEELIRVLCIVQDVLGALGRVGRPGHLRLEELIRVLCIVQDVLGALGHLRLEELIRVLCIVQDVLGALGHLRLDELIRVLCVVQDVLGALGHLRLDELPTMGLPPLIKELKVQHMKSRLNEIEAELRDKGKNFEPSNSVCGFIRACVIACDDEGVKQHATGLQDRIDNIIIEDFKRKYTVNTPVTHIADYERKVIGRKLRPKGERDPNLHPVCLRMHWEIKRDDLKQSMQTYNEDPRNFKMNEGYAKLLRFYISGPVPADIKANARQFLNSLEEAGLVSRPPPSARRGRFGGAQRLYRY